MSEELLQTIPQQIGKYTYYRLGSTTLSQLLTAGIIPKKSYEKLKAKKPDGLVTYHGKIKAVVEYKQPKAIQSEKGIEKAIAQEIEVARSLCKLMIVTDGAKSVWVNAITGERICDSSGKPLTAVFHPFIVKNLAPLEFLLDEVTSSVTATNSTIKSAKLVDPSPLAARLWQTIWVATGKSPVKCLYNVVELFIFRFLSDLEVLEPDDAFKTIHKKSLSDAEGALEFYARITRKKICKLFPHGTDGTTIINGTIFVTEDGEPNLSQSILFQRALGHLQKYGEEFGSLTKIDKQFKTKLYESFLQQEVEALGQYFTPRKVVRSVIRMAGMDAPTFQFAGKRFCDPFCGVGGFPLELLNMNESMLASYEPNAAKKIKVPFTLHGFDKGFERDDERTIILAKANMLIYLAELLFRYPACSKEFAKVFNETFRLFKDNLGTFGHLIDDEDEKYDFILSNPPYVTSGSSIIKEEIQKTPHTSKAYPVNAMGLEGLSLEWIVKSLKKGGRAFVVIPDGVLGRVGDGKLRKYILDECYLNAIVSLPERTFFPNNENTYILAITKKNSSSDVQSTPVFTYLVSEIGEKRTSVKREEIDEDNMPEMENLFRLFVAGASETVLQSLSGRCKVQPISRLHSESHWVVDRWWTRDEKIAIGAEKAKAVVASSEVAASIVKLDAAIKDYDSFQGSSDPLAGAPVKKVLLGDTSLFRLFIGKRVLAKDLTLESDGVPVYSANVGTPVGKIKKGNITDFSVPAVLWGIDGNFNFSLVPANQEFATTDHCGTIQILSNEVDPEYLMHALHVRRVDEEFDRSFRASLTNMRKFQIVFPITSSGKLNLPLQKKAAAWFVKASAIKARIAEAKRELDAAVSGFAR